MPAPTTPLHGPVRLRTMTHRIGNQGFDISPAPVDSNLSHPRSQRPPNQRPPKTTKQLDNEHRLRVRIKLEDEEAQGKLVIKEERAELNRRVKIEARKWQTKWRIAELEGNGRDALEAEQLRLEAELLEKIAANDAENERRWANGEPLLDIESELPDYGSGTEEVARDYSLFPHELPETAHFERDLSSSPDIPTSDPAEAMEALILEMEVNNGRAVREARRDNPLTSIEAPLDIATPRSAALITAAAALSIQHPTPALSALPSTQPPAILPPPKRPAASSLSSPSKRLQLQSSPSAGRGRAATPSTPRPSAAAKQAKEVPARLAEERAKAAATAEHDNAPVDVGPETPRAVRGSSYLYVTGSMMPSSPPAPIPAPVLAKVPAKRGRKSKAQKAAEALSSAALQTSSHLPEPLFAQPTPITSQPVSSWAAVNSAPAPGATASTIVPTIVSASASCVAGKEKFVDFGKRRAADARIAAAKVEAEKVTQERLTQERLVEEERETARLAAIEAKRVEDERLAAIALAKQLEEDRVAAALAEAARKEQTRLDDAAAHCAARSSMWGDLMVWGTETQARVVLEDAARAKAAQDEQMRIAAEAEAELENNRRIAARPVQETAAEKKKRSAAAKAAKLQADIASDASHEAALASETGEEKKRRMRAQQELERQEQIGRSASAIVSEPQERPYVTIKAVQALQRRPMVLPSGEIITAAMAVERAAEAAKRAQVSADNFYGRRRTAPILPPMAARAFVHHPMPSATPETEERESAVELEMPVVHGSASPDTLASEQLLEAMDSLPTPPPSELTLPSPSDPIQAPPIIPCPPAPPAATAALTSTTPCPAATPTPSTSTPYTHLFPTLTESTACAHIWKSALRDVDELDRFLTIIGDAVAEVRSQRGSN